LYALAETGDARVDSRPNSKEALLFVLNDNTGFAEDDDDEEEEDEDEDEEEEEEEEEESPASVAILMEPVSIAVMASSHLLVSKNKMALRHWSNLGEIDPRRIAIWCESLKKKTSLVPSGLLVLCLYKSPSSHSYASNSSMTA